MAQGSDSLKVVAWKHSRVEAWSNSKAEYWMEGSAAVSAIFFPFGAPVVPIIALVKRNHFPDSLSVSLQKSDSRYAEEYRRSYFTSLRSTQVLSSMLGSLGGILIYHYLRGIAHPSIPFPFGGVPAGVRPSHSIGCEIEGYSVIRH